MVRIAPVNLAYNPNTLWFDAGDLEIEPGLEVIVNTARGVEFGKVAKEVFDATDADIARLKSPLQSVVRIANSEDIEKNREFEKKAKEALVTFRELAAKTCKTMHPVSVEYLFDGNKAVFYFEAPKRLDFRELVRKLTSALHVRVDLRQINVRDRARIVGGCGHCGQELCCKRLGCGYSRVTIRMAKEQGLTLNQQKISGVCGRLMCCLNYEYEAYKDFNSHAPKVGDKVETPDGSAEVLSVNVPREVISVKLEDKPAVEVPLSGFEQSEEKNVSPKSIGKEAWQEACAPKTLQTGELIVSAFNSSQISGGDKLANREKTRQQNAKVVKQRANRKNSKPKSTKKKRKSKSRTSAPSKNNAHTSKDLRSAKNEFNNKRTSKSSNGRKVRRRSVKLNTSAGNKSNSNDNASKRSKGMANAKNHQGAVNKTAKYPGQKSGRTPRRQSGQSKSNSKQ